MRARLRRSRNSPVPRGQSYLLRDRRRYDSVFCTTGFSLLAFGGDSLDGNHQAWVIWAAVDTLLPLVLGVTGCRLWLGESGS